jgi:hypothetical protein
MNAGTIFIFLGLLAGLICTSEFFAIGLVGRWYGRRPTWIAASLASTAAAIVWSAIISSVARAESASEGLFLSLIPAVPGEWDWAQRFNLFLIWLLISVTLVVIPTWTIARRFADFRTRFDQAHA